MTLPADVARCPGREARIEAMETPDYWLVLHPQCEDCRRRDPAPLMHPWVSHMAPPEFIEGRCPMRIEPCTTI